MIKAINSTNFKSVIIPKYPKLSESQEKVVEDIRTKLGDQAEKKHFLITPLKDDVVELSQVYNVKNIGNGIELLDTPGTLWPSLDNQDVAKKLAFI